VIKFFGMNNSSYKLIRLIAPVCLLALAIGSCKKENEPSNELVRNFMPIDISVTAGDTIATLSWRPALYTSGKDVEYTLELSRDSLFSAAAEYSINTKNTQVTVNDRQLAVRQKYYGRIKANAYGNSEESKWYHSSSMTPLRGEQFFRPFFDGELTENKVTLRWVVNPGVTKITLTPITGSKIEVNLDATDKAAGIKAIAGLTPKTTYDAAIFVGPAQKGYLTFTTFAGTPTGANVVAVGPTDDLATMIQTAVAPGTIFVLQQGTKYTNDGTIKLPDNASFTIWGQPGPVKPILAFNVVTLPLNGGGIIKFENLDITGYQNADPALIKRSYFFNQSAATSTAEINFENCTIRNMVNSPLRLQGTIATVIINVEKLIVNKCMVYDIGWNGAGGTYAFIHNGAVAGRYNNIVVTNSSFYKIGYSLILLANTLTSASVQVDNNTFYNAVGDKRYLIDYSTYVIGGAFSFANNVIGKTASPAGTAMDIRSVTSPSVGQNTFKTSDAVFTGTPLSSIVNSGKTSTELFVDPDAGNFIFKDSNFAGRSGSGDPRWRNKQLKKTTTGIFGAVL
jgi:hypothetical protein